MAPNSCDEKAGLTIRTKDESVPDDSHTTMPLLGSYRLLIVMVGSLVLCSSFASQTSMTSAMVCMIAEEDDDVGDNLSYNSNNLINNSSSSSHSNSNSNNITRGHGVYYSSYDLTRSNAGAQSVNESFNESEPWKVYWDSQTQGWVVSAFFVGYYVIQIPSGVFVTRIGPKGTLVFGVLVTGILHMLSIPAARWSLPTLYVVRTLAGMTCVLVVLFVRLLSWLFTATSDESQGCMLPGVFALVANWCPHKETSMLFAITSNGIDLGSSFSFILALFGCETDFQGGWPLVFYFLGVMHIILAFAMVFCISDFPSTNPYVSEKEAKYIAKHRFHQTKATAIPLRRILGSRPVWAFIVAQFATDWLIAMVVTQGPLYLRDILRLPQWKTNMLSSVPFILSTPFGLIIGYASKKVVEKSYTTNTTARKVTESFAKLFSAFPLLVLMFLPKGAWVCVFVMYALVAAGIAGTYSGFMANPADLSPAHAGFVTSLGQTLSMWSAFVIPVFTAYLTQGKTRSSWQVIFNITIGINVFSLIFYILFGSGNLQPWAIEKVSEETPIIDNGNKKKCYTSTT